MRAHIWAKLTAGAGVLLMAAGCSSTTNDLDPPPGELDWDVAVTRAALLSGIDPAEGVYDPWQDEVVDLTGGSERKPISDEQKEAGLELLCRQLAIDDSDPIGNLYLGTVAQEAVNGAVLASMSEEFRAASSVLLVQASQFTGDDPSQEVTDAADAMTGELHDEWVELYELQTRLEEEVFTVEGAQASQAAVAERCDVTIDDADVVNESAPQYSPSLVQPPQAAASGADH